MTIDSKPTLYALRCHDLPDEVIDLLPHGLRDSVTMAHRTLLISLSPDETSSAIEQHGLGETVLGMSFYPIDPFAPEISKRYYTARNTAMTNVGKHFDVRNISADQNLPQILREADSQKLTIFDGSKFPEHLEMPAWLSDCHVIVARTEEQAKHHKFEVKKRTGLDMGNAGDKQIPHLPEHHLIIPTACMPMLEGKVVLHNLSYKEYSGRLLSQAIEAAATAIGMRGGPFGLALAMSTT